MVIQRAFQSCGITQRAVGLNNDVALHFRIDLLSKLTEFVKESEISEVAAAVRFSLYMVDHGVSPLLRNTPPETAMVR